MKTRLIFLLILLLMLQACSSQQMNDDEIYSIKGRAYDAVACSMLADVYDEPSIRSTRLTQLLYNQPIMIIGETEEFYEIQTRAQLSGFVLKNKISDSYISFRTDHLDQRILITGDKKTVYSRPDGKIPIKRVVTGTEFAFYGKSGDWIRVMMCGGEYGYLTLNDIILYEGQIPKTDVESFIRDVKRFSDIKYLKGGASVIEGFDMQNLVFKAARINGISIPVSMTGLLSEKETILPEEMQVGDILFLSSDRYNNNIDEIAVLIESDSVVLYSKDDLLIVTVRMIDFDIRNRIRAVIRLF